MPPSFEFLMRIAADVGEILTMGGGPLGERRFVAITGGSFEGPQPGAGQNIANVAAALLLGIANGTPATQTRDELQFGCNDSDELRFQELSLQFFRMNRRR